MKEDDLYFLELERGGEIFEELKVSASNAKQCSKKIWIYNTQDENAKFVYFSKQNNRKTD